VAAAVTAALAAASSAQAGLDLAYQFNGTGSWSVDAVGSNQDPVGSVGALVPAGSTVVKAFFYSSIIPDQNFTPSVSFDGVTYDAAAWTDLGANDIGLRAWRADVTSQVAAKVGGGGGLFNFEVRELARNADTDGELLAVIYSNPSEKERTIAVLDGFSATTGDAFQFNFADPLSGSSDPQFEALMSLGIGYSFQEGSAQYSQVDVNGQRLTTSAGGNDDGTPENGGLITAGGLDDTTGNPANPFALPTTARDDDELYNVKPFLSDGDTSILVETLNPSHDDNIFFTAFNITAKGDVTPPGPEPKPTVPEGGSTLALLGLALVGVAGCRRSK
jgi:hypothetical protein